MSAPVKSEPRLLRCIVVGQPRASAVFQVKASEGDSVAKLRLRIGRRLSSSLSRRGASAAQLMLFFGALVGVAELEQVSVLSGAFEAGELLGLVPLLRLLDKQLLKNLLWMPEFEVSEVHVVVALSSAASAGVSSIVYDGTTSSPLPKTIHQTVPQTISLVELPDDAVIDPLIPVLRSRDNSVASLNGRGRDVHTSFTATPSPRSRNRIRIRTKSSDSSINSSTSPTRFSWSFRRRPSGAPSPTVSVSTPRPGVVIGVRSLSNPTSSEAILSPTPPIIIIDPPSFHSNRDESVRSRVSSLASNFSMASKLSVLKTTFSRNNASHSGTLGRSTTASALTQIPAAAQSSSTLLYQEEEFSYGCSGCFAFFFRSSRGKGKTL
ncbi:hypothetical protein BCR33DRAFT_534167 [Rhizoclosmatium globosum]|uniref:Uncharacterized protein n=1 Tax=Rhizoclosmatium globosum TaxID=329046 RepID=A0A1Y2BD74_9FUNG|nr:hypothetical protein BCR33DRAFT_534167 [Rhizoclosmatium globosum]|eukprot:ORY32771.1 hypothetical protein BCR33DRAFT_534167 [Rhizoclosmatium globosum]